MPSNKTSAKTEAAAVVDNPQTAEEFTLRGWSYYAQKDYQKAEADYRRALELTPDRLDTLYALGMTLAYMGKSQEAVATFERFIECADENQNEEERVRMMMLRRLARGHISRIKTGEWRLEG